MNKQEGEILCSLAEKPYVSQRILAEESGHSLGIVNRSLKNLVEHGYLDEEFGLTEQATGYLQETAPKNAVILAAGYGMRMVPINTQTPKGLIEVKGQTLIERLILQLHEVGIRQIYVVVGFMKEQFEYLIDEYGVELVVNGDYATKNNLHSLNRVAEHLSNTYIVPCDIWCPVNPFRRMEADSWYMVSQRMSLGSDVRVNRKMELIRVQEEAEGNSMTGLCYLVEKHAKRVRQNLLKMCKSHRYDDAFWEETLYEKGKMTVQARVVQDEQVVAINTYEQLRELDQGSNHLKSEAISVICKAMQVKPQQITDITVLKKGMTNRSFLFTCKGMLYIMRIPGEGTDQLIDRKHEAAVYHAVAGRGICDDIRYIDPENGYKITGFIGNARVCDPENPEDVKKCMEKLRWFHSQNLQVAHSFDLFGQIEFYESLWEGRPSVFKDYRKTRGNVLSLKPYIEAHVQSRCLTHIDAVPDNFLFRSTAEGEEIRLIDWEYAGMQDPHVDIAMFCIYSLYERQQVDRTIDLYFPEGCPEATRTKIYCYIAVCGLLWSNWCEYKRMLGVEFGEYSLRQYRYAKEYYRIAKERMGRQETV